MSTSCTMNSKPIQKHEAHTKKATGWSIFMQGVHDAIQAQRTLLYMLQPAIQRRVAHCLLLNGVIFLGMMYVMRIAIHFLAYNAVFQTKKDIQQTTNGAVIDQIKQVQVIEAVLDAVYRVAWVYPIYIIAFTLSSIWHHDIAQQAFAVRNRKKPTSFTFQRWLLAMAEEIYRQLLQIAVLVQTEMTALVVPILGLMLSKRSSRAVEVAQWAGFVFYVANLSLYFAWYAYDYKWSMQQRPLVERIEHFEIFWPYYLGFGLPVAILTAAFPAFFNSGVFAMTFPFFLILAISAQPVEIKCGKPTNVPRLPIFYIAQRFNRFVLSMLSRRVSRIRPPQQL